MDIILKLLSLSAPISGSFESEFGFMISNFSMITVSEFRLEVEGLGSLVLFEGLHKYLLI